MTSVKPKVLILVNAEWYFISHRLPLARALRNEGFEVVIAAGVERGATAAIEQEGFRFIALDLRRRSTNLLQELRTLRDIVRLYREERPTAVHQVTIKPVIYGSIAARLARVPLTVNAITGMGSAFAQRGPIGAVIRWLLTLACRLVFMSEGVRVIFQNPEDRDWFVSRDILPARRSMLIRGSGVNVDQFKPSPIPAGRPIVLLASRLLWEKGVGEFVDASRLLRTRGVDCRFVLVGIPDLHNPNPIPEATLRDWTAEGVVEWWGLRDDMPAVIEMSTIVALPTTYQEGVPKILLEAAAGGRGMIATNVAGCREIVADNNTGLLLPPRDPLALANAIETLLRDRRLLERLASNARRLAVEEFSDTKTVAATVAVYREALTH